MKKNILFLLICIITFSSCKKNTINIEYQFSDKPDLFACSEVDMNLIKEAVYSFENDIIPYLESRRVYNLQKAYNVTVNLYNNKHLNVNEIASTHTKNIFKALKEKEGLWNESKTGYSLNYNSDVVNCAIENFLNDDLKTITKSLIETNSMSKKHINDQLILNYNKIHKDNGLRAFMALEYFYLEFFKTNN